MPTLAPDQPIRRSRGFAPQDVAVERRSDGALILTSRVPLPQAAPNSGTWLRRWAAEAPSRVFLAERSGAGWLALGYAEVLARVEALASALLARGLGAERPLAILSGNGVDHALMSLAAQYVGVPVVPMAEQYSLIPEAAPRLRDVLARVTPGLVFVDDASRYARALAVPELEGIEAAATRPAGAVRAVTPLAELDRGAAGVGRDAARDAVGPETLAKIFFTSGSTSSPKAVRCTHGMLCVNQAQIGAVWPFLGERPPVIVDWLPWNHVFGGSHNFNMMLANGGALYIDHGKPTPKGFVTSIENIRDKGGTIAFNVPAAYGMLIAEMRRDPGLRRAFFAELDMIFYAGASLPQDMWAALEEMALAERGGMPLMASSWGMTETAPSSIMVHAPIERAGMLGAPLPGVTLKLIPDADLRCELRVKGPNVMSGYHRDPARTAEAFDDEGFLVTGDAVRFVEPSEPSRGLAFDGRISEDFKLLTGTWVHVSKLRVEALPALAPLAQDLVIAGHDRAEIGALVFPTAEARAQPAAELAAALAAKLAALAARATGSSTRIARLLVLDEPPSLAEGETTDKGNLNQRKVLARRAALVERLYDDADPAVIRVRP